MASVECRAVRGVDGVHEVADREDPWRRGAQGGVDDRAERGPVEAEATQPDQRVVRIQSPVITTVSHGMSRRTPVSPYSTRTDSTRSRPLMRTTRGPGQHGSPERGPADEAEREVGLGVVEGGWSWPRCGSRPGAGSAGQPAAKNHTDHDGAAPTSTWCEVDEVLQLSGRVDAVRPVTGDASCRTGSFARAGGQDDRIGLDDPTAAGRGHEQTPVDIPSGDLGPASGAAPRRPAPTRSAGGRTPDRRRTGAGRGRRTRGGRCAAGCRRARPPLDDPHLAVEAARRAPLPRSARTARRRRPRPAPARPGGLPNARRSRCDLGGRGLGPGSGQQGRGHGRRSRSPGSGR